MLWTRIRIGTEAAHAVPTTLVLQSLVRPAGLLAVLLVAVIVGALFVAASDLPDPTLITGGLYDSNDEDEVVALLWEHSSATPPLAIRIPFRLTLVSLDNAAHPLSAGFALSRSFDSRAPPLA